MKKGNQKYMSVVILTFWHMLKEIAISFIFLSEVIGVKSACVTFGQSDQRAGKVKCTRTRSLGDDWFKWLWRKNWNYFRALGGNPTWDPCYPGRRLKPVSYEHSTGVAEFIGSFYGLSFGLSTHIRFSFVADFKQMRRRQSFGIL